MRRVAILVLIALALAACGGGDDDDDDPPASTGGAPTATVSSEVSTAESTVAEATPAGSTGADAESAEGAPTHSSDDFPDVQVPLEVGSSGTVGSMDPDPFSDTSSRNENSTVTVTINEILDPAVIEGTLFGPEPGNRWWAVNITIEATGSEIANTGIWTLATTDANQYTNTVVLGSTPDVTYGSLAAGASETGGIVFEIPEDAVVQWLLMSPTIFVGENLVFVN